MVCINAAAKVVAPRTREVAHAFRSDIEMSTVNLNIKYDVIVCRSLLHNSAHNVLDSLYFETCDSNYLIVVEEFVIISNNKATVLNYIRYPFEVRIRVSPCVSTLNQR